MVISGMKRNKTGAGWGEAWNFKQGELQRGL